MKILVTGGAGFIGSHLSERLLSLSHEVVCIDDFNDYYLPAIKEENLSVCKTDNKFCVYKLDIRDLGSLNRVFEEHKIDIIIHLGARAGIRSSINYPSLYEEVNVKGTLNLLEIAKNFKISRFIFGSSSSVYGLAERLPFSEDDNTDKPLSPYAATKKSGELLCYSYHHLYSINIACLRFFTVYGPRNRPDMAIYRFADSLVNDTEIVLYSEKYTKRDFTYITDIIDGIIQCVERNIEWEVLNLGSSRPIELRYLIYLLEIYLGKKAKIKKEALPKSEVPVTYADISRAKNVLGYNPKIKFEEGIKKFVEWYKSHKKIEGSINPPKLFERLREKF